MFGHQGHCVLSGVMVATGWPSGSCSVLIINVHKTPSGSRSHVQSGGNKKMCRHVTTEVVQYYLGRDPLDGRAE